MSRSGGGRTGQHRPGGIEALWVPKRGAADNPGGRVDDVAPGRSARQNRRAAEAAERRANKRRRPVEDAPA